MSGTTTLLLGLVALGLLADGAVGCGYQSCPSSYDTTKVQLHIVAHSHDDVGWLKTADGYYDEDVQHLLSNVVQALQRNPKRKFVEVEMYYFQRWWQRQSNQTQEVVRALVKSGQFTFANGGWCVNDEAAAHYNQIIDQMTLGIQFLRQTFGECAEPKLSWQVDPFGASREMANLYAMMDFDGHIVNRGHNLRGEFFWNTSEDNSILTSTLHAHYSAPRGFDFEDGNDITEQNKVEKAKTLAELGKRWNKDYGSKGHVLITFGDDFKYQHAEHYFSNLDKLIEVVNKNHPDVNLFYSSPHCYIKAIKELKPKLEQRSHDYFPLWTGFFSSRPQVKYLDRYANNLLQAAKQLEVIAELNNTQSFIFESKNQLGVLQHHDAITGTSKEPVMLDYKQRLVSAIMAASTVISRALGRLTSKDISSKGNQPYVYTTVNISQLGVSFDSSALASIIYNPLAHEQSVWIRVPVSGRSNYRLYDSDGNELSKVSHVPIPSKVKAMVGHHKEITHELVFNASLPALGFTTYFISHDASSAVPESNRSIALNADKDLLLKGKNFELVLDSTTGQTKYLVKGGKSHRVVQSFHYYPSKGTSSSYEFCPSSGAVDLSDYSSSIASAVQFTGFAEVAQRVNDWIWQTVRVYEDKEFVEYDWIVGPVSDQPAIGKDIVTRFDTDLITKDTFFTDANGRQNIERHRSEEIRKCLGTQNAISYNYYPITSRAILKDAQAGLELSILPDRSVGASSQQDGQVELMIHRRLFDRATTDIPVDDKDEDGKGVVARGKVFLFLSDQASSADQYRQQSQFVFMQPVVGFVPTSNMTQYRNEHRVHFTGLKVPLPSQVHLLTLENWGNVGNNEVMVRFENFYQSHERSKLAAPASFNAADVFSTIKVTKVVQTNLVVGSRRNSSSSQVTLGPSQIGTFVYQVDRKLTISKCALKWQKRVDRKLLPQGAIKAGHEANGQALYICRHPGADLMPGKFGETIKCHLSFGGKELSSDDDQVEILTGTESQYQWVPHHGGDSVPDDAFVAGKTAQGLPIQVGRCNTPQRGQVVGKVDEYFFYAFGGEERRDCPNYEILVC